jgi:mutator protein MutT
MQLQQLVSRFILRPLPQQSPQPATGLRQSAVLVPLVFSANQLNILFTRRALTLAHHPGQISFPGGMLEPGESAADAALRETEEEIGISPQRIRLLGTLPAHNTLTGFQIQPYLGLMHAGQNYQLSSAEVSEVFEVPLSFFLPPQHRLQLTVPLRGKSRQIHFMPYQDKLIWGATAAIIQQLVTHVS